MTQAHLFSLLVNVYNLTNTLLIFLLYTRSLGLKAWSVASVSSRWSSGFRKKVVLSAFPWGDTCIHGAEATVTKTVLQPQSSTKSVVLESSLVTHL